MAEVKFNYIDNINSSTYFNFVSDQHDQAINMTGRKTYIFKLDKVDTELSEVYREEKHGRVYLPHFEQRALYKTSLFISQLDTQNFTEKENNLELEYNFGRMVHNIHELKSKSVGVLNIKNISKIPLTIEIDKSFILRNNSELLYETSLGGSIFSFLNKLKETSLIEASYSGDGESLDFIEKVNLRLLPRRNIDIQLSNSIYKNVTDVIDRGDIIVTDRKRVYQVVAAYPRDDNYQNYVSWKIQGELINLAKVDGMPNDFAELIKENQYNLGKINI